MDVSLYRPLKKKKWAKNLYDILLKTQANPTRKEKI